MVSVFRRAAGFAEQFPRTLGSMRGWRRRTRVSFLPSVQGRFPFQTEPASPRCHVGKSPFLGFFGEGAKSVLHRLCLPLLATSLAMGKKAAKSARKFAASGQLQKTIQARRKHQQFKKKTQSRTAARSDFKGKSSRAAVEDSHSGNEEDEDDEGSGPSAPSGKTKCVQGSIFSIEHRLTHFCTE